MSLILKYARLGGFEPGFPFALGPMRSSSARRRKTGSVSSRSVTPRCRRRASIRSECLIAWQERQLPDAGIIDTRTRRSPSNGGVASFSPLPFDGGRGWNISTTPLTAPPTQQFPSAAHNTARPCANSNAGRPKPPLNEKPQPLSHVAGAKFGFTVSTQSSRSRAYSWPKGL